MSDRTKTERVAIMADFILLAARELRESVEPFRCDTFGSESVESERLDKACAALDRVMDGGLLKAAEKAHALALTAAVQAEREACARICDDMECRDPGAFGDGYSAACNEIQTTIMARSRGPAPAVDVLAVVREYVEAKDALQLCDRETVARANAAESALRALVSPATGEGKRCTCDYDHVNDDEHRPWCGGPKPVRITEDEQREWKERFAAEDAETQRIVNEVQAIIDEAKDGGAKG